MPIKNNFVNTMTRGQKVAGFIYLPIHIIVLPILVSMLAYYSLSGSLGDFEINLIYYGTGLVFTFIVMFKFLRGAFDVLVDNARLVIVNILVSFAVYFALAYIVTVIMLLLTGGDLQNSNQEAVSEMVDSGFGRTAGITIFIVPIVEEMLFRGVLFGSIREKNRAVAYIVSMLVFGLYHVWQYALVYLDVTQLLYAVQYFPAGYALARCYERTNTIWAPIFLHMTINLLAMLAMTIV